MMDISVVLPILTKGDPYLIELTRFCIETMRLRTDTPFELIVVETGSDDFEPSPTIDKVIHREPGSGYTSDFLAGQDAATGDHIVHIGNDVIVGDQWLEAMSECFGLYQDCGIATIAMSEPGYFIGPPHPQVTISESFYGPVMMFPKWLRFDEQFRDQMNDYDLAMQAYAHGKRAYRNNRTCGFHMKLEHNISREETLERFQKGVDLFEAKWGGAPWLIKDLMIRGGATYTQRPESPLPFEIRRPIK